MSSAWDWSSMEAQPAARGRNRVGTRRMQVRKIAVTQCHRGALFTGLRNLSENKLPVCAEPLRLTPSARQSALTGKLTGQTPDHAMPPRGHPRQWRMLLRRIKRCWRSSSFSRFNAKFLRSNSCGLSLRARGPESLWGCSSTARWFPCASTANWFPIFPQHVLLHASRFARLHSPSGMAHHWSPFL